VTKVNLRGYVSNRRAQQIRPFRSYRPAARPTQAETPRITSARPMKLVSSDGKPCTPPPMGGRYRPRPGTPPSDSDSRFAGALVSCAQERPPGRVHPPRGRPVPPGTQDPPHRRRADVVAEPAQLAVHPAVSPARVLPRQLRHQAADVLAGPRSAGLVWGGPFAGDQPSVPGQKRARRDEPATVQYDRQVPGQRRQDGTVGQSGLGRVT
jgi:hypothetical protein